MFKQQWSDVINGLSLSPEEERFVGSTETFHTIVNIILERLNRSDFAYKRGKKSALLLGSPDLTAYFQKQDHAANVSLLNTAHGLRDMLNRWESETTGPIKQKLDHFTNNPHQFDPFRTSMLNAFAAAAIEDDSLDSINAAWGTRALDYYLQIAHKDGFDALFKHLRRALNRFIHFRENLDEGRDRLSDSEFKMAAPYFTGSQGDDVREKYDPVHVWVFDLIVTGKVVIRLVCYIFIICFVWEEEEYIEEIKKVFRCTYVDPRDTDRPIIEG